MKSNYQKKYYHLIRLNVNYNEQVTNINHLTNLEILNVEHDCRINLSVSNILIYIYY